MTKQPVNELGLTINQWGACLLTLGFTLGVSLTAFLMLGKMQKMQKVIDTQKEQIAATSDK